MSALAELGWNAFFEQQEIMSNKSDGEPARVIAEHKNTYVLSRGKDNVMPASLSGNFLYHNGGQSKLISFRNSIQMSAGTKN